MSLLQKAQNAATELSFHLGLVPPSMKEGLKHFTLVYHGVAKENDIRFNARHEPLAYFDKQMHFLKKNFHIIPLRDFFEKKFLEGRINVAITFDDGYRNNYLYAKPVLEKYQLPATFFVSGLNDAGEKMLWADFLNIISYFKHEEVLIDGEPFEKKNGEYVSKETGILLPDVIRKVKPDLSFKHKVFQAFGNGGSLFQDQSLTDFWQLMSNEEITECSASPFIEIGSHGYYHNNLGNISLSAATEELRLSKHYLENLIQQPVLSIAYPDSSYSRNLLDIAEQTGFKYQLAVGGFLFREDSTDNRIRNRIGIYNVGSCGNQLLARVKKAIANRNI